MILEINSSKENFEYLIIDDDEPELFRLIGDEEISIKGIEENIFFKKGKVIIPKNMISGKDGIEEITLVHQRNFDINKITKEKSKIIIETNYGNVEILDIDNLD
ncbi:MAG: hypothetical protein PHT94_02980 [Candidatus Nanoarchaeia archaeon]|nr:hypothetical protein [Candidatus Nanoarchaeia archaeon]